MNYDRQPTPMSPELRAEFAAFKAKGPPKVATLTETEPELLGKWVALKELHEVVRGDDVETFAAGLKMEVIEERSSSGYLKLRDYDGRVLAGILREGVEG